MLLIEMHERGTIFSIGWMVGGFRMSKKGKSARKTKELRKKE